MFLAEVLGVFLTEHFVEMFAGIVQLFAAGDKNVEVCHHHDALQQRHSTFVEVFPNLVAYEKQFGFGMVHDVVYIVCLELVKDGDDYRTVGQCCEERYAPVGTVAATDGNLIAFLDAACLENDMQLFYFAGYVLIL